MHPSIEGFVTIDIDDHLVVQCLEDAVSRVWHFLFAEVPESCLVCVSSDEVNLQVNDLLEENAECSMHTAHLLRCKIVVDVKNTNSNQSKAYPGDGFSCG